MLGLNRDNSVFFYFICLEKEEGMMQKNSLSIHIETGNVFMTTLIRMKAFMIFCLRNRIKIKK